MFTPSLEEFVELAKQGNLVPVYREILADTETPVSAFMKIDDGPYAYLLESVEGGEKWARYSFLGSRPSVVLRRTAGEWSMVKDGRPIKTPKGRDPLEVLQRLLARYRPVPVRGLPRFSGGAVGFLGYDVVSEFERLPMREKEGLSVPDLAFVITDTLLIFDNAHHMIKVVSNALIGHGGPERAYRKACEKIERIIRKLKRGRPLPERKPGDGPPTFISNMPRPEFEKMVRRGKEYITAGDVIQVVLSQRFDAPVRCAPFDVYRALRLVNPSPYMFYLKLDDTHIVGSSPEILVRCEEGNIALRPIAGTRRRGETEEQDRALEQELLADEKERAEHLMLVDLGRNDVGRVAETGTVEVDEFMAVERYSHVMHLVSNVTSRLKKGKNVFDLLRSCFPAGTVSGAPKIRAMEIIEELEPTRRGPYAGAVGYFSFSGNMDTCITIRTLVIREGKASVQAGGGIVADSDPAAEYQESANKAKGMMRAIELAEKGLE